MMRCPNPIYSIHPNSRLVKRRRVPTAAEQCGCTILRELARRVANSSHSVAPSAHNSVLRSSNMKTSPQRAERRRGWRVGYGPRRRSQFVILRNLESGAKLFCGCRSSNHQYRLYPLVLYVTKFGSGKVSLNLPIAFSDTLWMKYGSWSFAHPRSMGLFG